MSSGNETALSRSSLASGRPGRLERFARRQLIARLDRLHSGRITLVDHHRELRFGDPADHALPEVRVEILSSSFYTSVALGGGTGAAEAWMRGDWRCDDLVTLMRLLLRNRDILMGLEGGLAILAKPLRRLAHFFNRNSRSGSRRNIAAHYDLGNDFYSLWLDRTMMYSSAWFADEDVPLETASVAKLDMICRKLNLVPTDSVIEIGTGWGGFAVHAAREYGCRVTTTTISRRQYEFATNAVKEAGVEHLVTVLLEDYRDLSGDYDKLVSIEMVEAVGHQFHELFFRKCCELLKPGGQMLIQAITIPDQRYDHYKRHVDFIRQYIFPGGCLMSVADMLGKIARHTDMRLTHAEDIGLHYARTVQHWRSSFLKRLDAVRNLGYPPEFVRMWHYYLCFCESAFLEKAIGDIQLVAERPR